MFPSAYPAMPIRPACASEIIPPYADRKTRLAAPMPRMNVWVSTVSIQKSETSSGASSARTSTPTPITRSTTVFVASMLTRPSRTAPAA